MDIGPMCKRVIGLEVHQAQTIGCAIIEHDDGTVTQERREFGSGACCANSRRLQGEVAVRSRVSSGADGGQEASTLDSGTSAQVAAHNLRDADQKTHVVDKMVNCESLMVA